MGKRKGKTRGELKEEKPEKEAEALGVGCGSEKESTGAGVNDIDEIFELVKKKPAEPLRKEAVKKGKKRAAENDVCSDVRGQKMSGKNQWWLSIFSKAHIDIFF
eukprot:Sdes_comp18914_c0_seq1m9366